MWLVRNSWPVNKLPPKRGRLQEHKIRTKGVDIKHRSKFQTQKDSNYQLILKPYCDFQILFSCSSLVCFALRHDNLSWMRSVNEKRYHSSNVKQRLCGFAIKLKFMIRNTITNGDSTVLHTAYTVYTIYTVCTVKYCFQI